MIHEQLQYPKEPREEQLLVLSWAMGLQGNTDF